MENMERASKGKKENRIGKGKRQDQSLELIQAIN